MARFVYFGARATRVRSGLPAGTTAETGGTMSDLKTELTGFTGTVLRPGDEGYDDARSVFNGLIDRRPALIARCTSAEDVAAAVRFGRAEALTISVYGGGHSVTGAAVY